MLIDSIISFSKNMDYQKKGSNKKCFLFDEYVLLSGKFKQSELEKVMIIEQELKNDGVNLYPTLEYSINKQPNENGYSSGYILQERAKGEELYDSKMTMEEYEKRLKQIVEIKSETLDKYITDWIKITKSGLMIDPSKCSNFFYYDDKISFIDLNLYEHYNKKRDGVMFYEVYSVLTGLGLKYEYRNIKEKYNDYMGTLFKKVLNVFVDKKIPIDEKFFSRAVEECYNKDYLIEDLLEKDALQKYLKMKNFSSFCKMYER